MVLLDTNVVSEVMRPEPTKAVIDWLNSVDAGTLYLSTVSIGEIELGLELLPDGRRRDELRARFDDFLVRAFSFRILPFDEDAAAHYGRIMGARRRMGRPVSVPDGQIAAIARSRGMTIATRNTDDFSGHGLDVINPWDTGGSE